MLPGSLANLLAKHSEDLMPRMTPAVLPGFHADVHSETQQPCILQSLGTDFVHGMLVLGQGRPGRNLIHQHYQPRTRRVKVQIELDVVVPKPAGYTPTERWYLKRRRIWAYAWLWSNAGSGDVLCRSTTSRWTLEDCIAGDLGPKQSLRIEPNARGDEGEDGEIDVSSDCGNQEEREVIYGGCGHLDYDRVDAFTGW